MQLLRICIIKVCGSVVPIINFFSLNEFSLRPHCLYGISPKFLSLRGKGFNLITACRVGCSIDSTCVIIRGAISDFLSDSRFQFSSWVIQIATETAIENHTISWDGRSLMWNYEGVTYETK